MITRDTTEMIGGVNDITTRSTKTITIGTMPSRAIGVNIGPTNIVPTQIGIAPRTSSGGLIGIGVTSEMSTTIATIGDKAVEALGSCFVHKVAVPVVIGNLGETLHR